VLARRACESFCSGYVVVVRNLNVVPNTPGPWTIAETFIADWGGYGLTFNSDSLHMIIDPGHG
jgi:hypothetical protein